MKAHGMVGHMIRRLNQLSTQVFFRHMQEAGLDLTSVQFAAMDAILENPGIDQAGVAGLIGYDRATIGGVIDRLVQKGLVARQVSKRDRRAREVALTPEGEALFQRMLPIVAGLQAEIVGRLTPEEQAIFFKLARKAIGEDRDEPRPE
nr:MarR family transcriptional regulator [Pseudoprimorskyibacter insulae]